jgi:hypothetical protein
MSRLIYCDAESGFGVVVAKAGMPKNLYETKFSEFSEIVSRDPRVPPVERTSVGFKIEESTNPDFKGRMLWHPSKMHKNAFGCCLFPRVMLDAEDFFSDVYAFGFQGKDGDTLISGLFGYGNGEAQEMYTFSTGARGAGVIESSMDRFFQMTGLKPLDFDKGKMESFQKGAMETVKIIGGDERDPNFVDYGLFVPSAFVATETLVGQSVRSIHVKDPAGRV